LEIYIHEDVSDESLARVLTEVGSISNSRPLTLSPSFREMFLACNAVGVSTSCFKN